MNTKKKSERLSKVLNQSLSIVIFVVLICGICIFILLSFYFVLYSNSKKDINQKDWSILTISHFNTLSNKSSVRSIKTSSKFLKNEEFATFRTKNNEIFSVIHSSKFSTEEFECFGTCFCKEYEKRRNVNILSKSIYFLISAISFSLAVKIASSYFSEECFNSLKNICSDKNIESEINFCDLKANDENILNSEDLENEKREAIHSFDDEDGLEREFHCEGFCFPNGRLKVFYTKIAAKKFECEKFVHSGNVKVIERGKLGFLSSSGYQARHKAKLKFAKEQLREYCKSVSPFSYKTEGREGENLVHLCVAGKRGNGYTNIRCYVKKPFSTYDGRVEKRKYKESNP